MQENTWFVEAVKDLAEYAKQSNCSGLLCGLSSVIDTYVKETDLPQKQREEVSGILKQAGHSV